MLLDTHVLLRVLGAPERLLPEVAKRITDPAPDVHVSAATAHEISIQYALGKLRFRLARTPGCRRRSDACT